MAALADEVAAAHQGTLDVVGVSMGGMVAQHLAIRHPDRVRSALVACTGAFADPAVMAGRARAAERGAMAGVLDDTLERWFTPEFRTRTPEPDPAAYARRTLLGLDPSAFADGWRAIATHDARPGLAGVSARVTCVAGRDDAAASLERVSQIADAVPGARLTVLDGPHMIHLEQPQAFSAAVREHLDRVAA
jgi:pimeloyl-ACP methyl ester carboxylesterase